MNQTLTAQDVASMSQDEFDKLDDGVINSLLTGGDPGGQGTPPAAESRNSGQSDLSPNEGSQRQLGASNEGPKAEDDDPEAITIDEDGRARNAKGKFVPHKALHAEREEHKKTRASLQQAEIEKAKYSERLAMLLQAIEPEKPAPQAEQVFQPIDVEQDLIGALKQMQEVALKGRGRAAPEVQQLQQRLDQMDAHNQVKQISDRYASDINAAKANAEAMPEFDDAVRHLVMQQDAMLAAQGWNDANARRSEIQAAERNFVLKAYKEGANPAQRLYDMARAVGWQPKGANGGGSNGGASSAVEQRIDNIARMQRSSPSLSTVPGGGGDSLPSAAQVAAMSEEAFDALVNKVGGLKNFERRYMGRER